MSDPQSKTAFFNKVAEQLLEFQEELERTNYIEAVAAKYLIREDELRKLVNNLAMKGGVVKTPQPLKSGVHENKKKEDGMKQSQKLLLTWLIEDTRLFETIKGLVDASDFTEELYHKAACEVFQQFEKDGTVNPAKIVSLFDNEEEQAEIAALFNASIHEVESKADMEKAVKETVIRIKQNSIRVQSQNMDPTDLNGMMKTIEQKRALEKLEKMNFHIV